MWKESVWCRIMWPKWILTLPLPKYQRGPRPLPAPSVQGILASPSNHRRGLRPLPVPSCPGMPLISPSNHQRSSTPFQSLPVQEVFDLPLHSPEEPRPLPTPFLPLVYQAWPLEKSVLWEALNKDGSGVDCSQFSTPDNVCKLLLSHFRKLYLKICHIISCLVLITIVF